MKLNYSKYILSTFKRIYAVPDSVAITYGEQPAGGVHIPNHAQDFFLRHKPADPEKVAWKKREEINIPFLFESNEDEAIISNKIDTNTILINYDLVASSFYLLSGWHEHVSDERDAYGRCPYKASIQKTLGITSLPVVNYYFDILKEAVETRYEIRLEPYPKLPYSFNLALTHDIDLLYSGWLQEGYAALKTFRWLKALKIASGKIARNDPWNNLDDLIAFSNRHGIQSSFYFLPEQKKIRTIQHADYAVEDAAIRETMQRIKDLGSEVGIHGPVDSHTDVVKLNKYIKKIGGEITGGRFHYLSYDPESTAKTLERSSLYYDSTLGFAEHTGFRNSFAHPFHVYDLKNDRPTSILEIPLVIMDMTLAKREYMNLPPQKAFETAKPVLKGLKKFKGGAAILWHNNFFSDIKYEGWRDVLEQIIGYTKKHGARMGTAKSLYEDYGELA